MWKGDGVISITNNAPDAFALGDTVVTWTATDQDGNSATATQLVSVVDTTAPELTIPQDVIIDAISIEFHRAYLKDFFSPIIIKLFFLSSIL